jgi:hypothetical protein
MMRLMRLLDARVDAAKSQLEHEVAALYAEYHKCSDPVKRSEIKRQIDAMIENVERKKGDTETRLKKK